MAEPRGAVSGSPSERWRSICFGNQALSFCKIAPQPQNPGCEMKILLLAAPNCCLPPAAPRRPALTPSHLRRAQKKSRLRTSCAPLGLPPHPLQAPAPVDEAAILLSLLRKDLQVLN